MASSIPKLEVIPLSDMTNVIRVNFRKPRPFCPAFAVDELVCSKDAPGFRPVLVRNQSGKDA